MAIKFYTGVTLTTKEESKRLGIDPYLPAPSLVEAVRLAQILQRPLLLKGEPGCGKSRLAEAIAAEIFDKGFQDFYFTWNIKSTSKAVDGLYQIDNLERLSNANLKENVDLKIDLAKDKEGNYLYNKKGNYIELGELGKAFLLSNAAGLKAPPVVLIDEIDKADIDFPNDLLLELDRMYFEIPEIKDKDNNPIKIVAKEGFKPLFIITSNDEKPLPPAFLRRCLFHYIEFKDIKLEEIVASKFPELQAEDNLIKDAVNTFKSWREKIAEKGSSNKNITTSELLDWVKLINYNLKTEPDKVKFTKDELPPYHQALLKDVESIQVFAKKDSQPLQA